MVPVRVIGLAILLLALPLSGCLGGSDTPPAPPPAPPPSPTAEAYTGVSVADAKQHIHDYWENRTEVVLLEQTFQTPAAPSGEWWFSLLGGVFFDQEVRSGRIDFTLGNNTAVYEGTGQLIVDVDSTAALKSGQQRLSYHSGAITGFVPLEPQAAAASWTIDLTPEMADLPHSQNTRWRWVVEAFGEAAVLDGPIHVMITAVKGYEPEEWPAHPDFWQNRTKLQVAGNWSSTFSSQEVFFVAGSSSNLRELVLPDGKLVPHGTRVLEIDLQYAFDGNPTNGAYDGVVLYVQTADANRGYFARPLESAPGQAHYVYQIEESMADSPYASESAWRFHLILKPKADQGVGGRALFAAYLAQAASGSWTINAWVYDHDLPSATPLRDMDRGGDR